MALVPLIWRILISINQVAPGPLLLSVLSVLSVLMCQILMHTPQLIGHSQWSEGTPIPDYERFWARFGDRSYR